MKDLLTRDIGEKMKVPGPRQNCLKMHLLLHSYANTHFFPFFPFDPSIFTWKTEVTYVQKVRCIDRMRVSIEN